MYMFINRFVSRQRGFLTRIIKILRVLNLKKLMYFDSYKYKYINFVRFKTLSIVIICVKQPLCLLTDLFMKVFTHRVCQCLLPINTYLSVYTYPLVSLNINIGICLFLTQEYTYPCIGSCKFLLVLITILSSGSKKPRFS